MEVDLQCSEMVWQFNSRDVQIREVKDLNIYQKHALLLELGGSIFDRSFISNFAAPKMINSILQAFGKRMRSDGQYYLFCHYYKRLYSIDSILLGSLLVLCKVDSFVVAGFVDTLHGVGSCEVC